MSRPVRIRVDRLVLDGLPAGTTPAAIERAVRAALDAGLAGRSPGRSVVIPSLRIAGNGGSVGTAMRQVADAVAGIAGTRR